MTNNNGARPQSNPAAAYSLNFVMQPKEQTYWGWAAIAASLKQFYEPSATLTQCELASTAFGINCCTDGESPECNQSAKMEDILASQGLLQETVNSALTLPELISLLYAAQPVVVEIVSSDGQTMIPLVIFGYNNENPAEATITIADPFGGMISVVLFSQFPGNYIEGFYWNQTFITKGS